MRHRLPLALAACALPLLLAAACGGEGESAPDGTPRAAGASGTTASSVTVAANTAQPVLTAPVNRFIVLLQDLPVGAYLTNIPYTITLNAKDYGGTKAFNSAADGEKQLNDWGYLGGYETQLIPEGRDAAVLNGAYYIWMEVHLFRDIAGAEQMYDHMTGRVRANKVSQEISALPVGNESAATKTIGGKIAGSKVDTAIHQVLFRRGNLFVVVRTDGADPFMRVDSVSGIAAIIDAKALGERLPVEPTPISLPSRTSTATPGGR